MRSQLPSLKTADNGLEDSIIVISGPALAISGIIAGVDLLTGGNLLKTASWLSMAWAICLLLTLDFQVLALGARAHKVYLSDKSTGRKVLEVLLAFLIAAAISYVSIQMQSIIARSNSAPGLSIDMATAQLGINPIALVWERSALVLVLIFMSGWFREEQHTSAGVSLVPVAVSPVPPPETAAPISDETVQLILTKLAKLDALEQALDEHKTALLTLPRPGETTRETAETANEASSTEADETSLDEQLALLLEKAPDLSSRDIAAIVGKPHSTVYRAIGRVKQMKQQVKQSA